MPGGEQFQEEGAASDGSPEAVRSIDSVDKDGKMARPARAGAGAASGGAMPGTGCYDAAIGGLVEATTN